MIDNKNLITSCVVLFLVLFFVQCKNNNFVEGDTIMLPFSVKGTYPSVSESGYEFSYTLIPLETKDECLLGRIFSIKRYKDYLYIHSIFNKAVMIFSYDGKFIKKIPIGRGPGELMDPLYLVIDEENEQLEVLDFFKQIKRYSLTGDFIGMHECKLSMEFEKIDSSYLYYLYPSKNHEYCFKINGLENDVDEFVNLDRVKKAPLMAYSHLFKADSLLYFHTDFNNIVYKISKNGLKPKPYATIINQCTADKMKGLSDSEIKEYCVAHDLYLNMLNFNVLHNGRTIYAEMITSNDVDVFLYNLDNQKTYRMDNQVGGCILGSSGDFQYDYIPANLIGEYLEKEHIIKNKLLYEKLVDLSTKVHEEDNPIVVEIKIEKKV